MRSIQDVFNRMQETKKKQKELKAMYRDGLAQSEQYQEIKEKLATLRAKKKEIEIDIQRDFRKEFDQLDEIKTDLDSDAQLLSDIAINQLVKGEKIEIADEYDNEYEPVFSVKFNKVK